jgi:DNA-directed RNA polymerase specialized sigma24 family protein
VDIDTRARRAGLPDASVGVTELYQAHAVGLIKLGVIMLGDRTAAEDVVQDAFFGLYRNWGRLSDPDNAQREALVLRFYLGVTEEETARAMGISRGTVKSSTSRALAALGRMLKEES